MFSILLWWWSVGLVRTTKALLPSPKEPSQRSRMDPEPTDLSHREPDKEPSDRLVTAGETLGNLLNSHGSSLEEVGPYTVSTISSGSPDLYEGTEIEVADDLSHGASELTPSAHPNATARTSTRDKLPAVNEEGNLGVREAFSSSPRRSRTKNMVRSPGDKPVLTSCTINVQPRKDDAKEDLHIYLAQRDEPMISKDQCVCSDDGGAPHEKFWTCYLVFRTFGGVHCISSGRLILCDAEQYDQIGGKHYYKTKKLAKKAVAGRAMDCMRFRDAQNVGRSSEHPSMRYCFEEPVWPVSLTDLPKGDSDASRKVSSLMTRYGAHANPQQDI